MPALPKKSRTAPKAVRALPRALLIDVSRNNPGNQRVLSVAGGFLKAYADAKLPGKFEVKTLNLYHFYSERALDFIKAWKPQVVGFSCYLWNSERVRELCRRIKAEDPRRLIILGGPEATGMRAALLKKCGADALVIGEGEAAFTELLARFAAGRDWRGTPGVLVRSGGRIHDGPPREVIPDLDEIPSPFKDAAATLGLSAGSGFFSPFETMRGCPNKCSFCTWTNLRANKLRYFSDERIASDLRWVAKNAPEAALFVTDSDLFLDHARALRLAPLFHAAAGKCSFAFQTNLNHWDDRLMRAWNHEKFEVQVGVNSVNPDVQKALGRVCPKSLVEEKLARMRRLAPKTAVTMQLMFAAPGETFAGFCEGFDWAWRQPVARRIFFHTQMLYGTRLRERAGELGINFREVPPYYIVSTKECPAEKIKLESLMVIFVTVWMALPGTRKMFLDLAGSHFKGSFSAAFLKIWAGMDAPARRLAGRTVDLFKGGSDWFQEDYLQDLGPGGAPKEVAPFLKLVNDALLKACAKRQA